MNRKNITLILIGIFIISMEFPVSIGRINFDITNDIIGFALIIPGALSLRKLNSRFNKSFIISIIGLIAAVFSQIIKCMDWGSATTSTVTAATGLTVIFAIYFTYYFTEGMIMESKVQEKLAVARNYQISWFILSISIFAHYVIFLSKVSFASIAVEALVGICAIYYCFSVSNTCKELFR